MHELQDLGADLVELSAGQLKRIEAARGHPRRRARVPADHRARRPPPAVAVHRQADARASTTTPIRAGLALLRGESASETARLHRLERLRERSAGRRGDAHRDRRHLARRRPPAPAPVAPQRPEGAGSRTSRRRISAPSSRYCRNSIKQGAVRCRRMRNWSSAWSRSATAPRPASTRTRASRRCRNGWPAR